MRRLPLHSFVPLAAVLACSLAHAGAPKDQSPGADDALLDYHDVPYIFTQSPALFEDLLLNRHPSPTRIAFFGDSTAFDILGAGGPHMSWRRWLWHQYHGHTPGTQLSRSSSFGGMPHAEFMFTGSPLYWQDGTIPTDWLPPGFSGDASKAFSAAITWAAGMQIQLNHVNDNHLTAGCPTQPNGFYAVAPAIGQGVPQFAVGTMAEGRSLIDAAAALHVEVLAAARPGSAPSVWWALMPQDNFCVTNAFVPPIQSGLLFGGAQSLDAPLGNVFRAQTPALVPLSGSQRYYRVTVSGFTDDADGAVQIIGARFVSDNPVGLIIDSFSHSAYTSVSMMEEHPNCGPILAAGGYTCAWLMYGLNDQTSGYSAETFKDGITSTVDFIRQAMGDSGFPIILETCSSMVLNNTEGHRYAGALYAIAQSDPRVMFVNSRRVAEERFGWGTGNEWQYLSDGVHYTNAGAEAMARSSIESILDYFDAGPLPCIGDIDLNGGVNIDDLLIVINGWGGGAGPADVIVDGVVNIDDLLVVINSWGPCG